jgi:hypothetical protein
MVGKNLGLTDRRSFQGRVERAVQAVWVHQRLCAKEVSLLSNNRTNSLKTLSLKSYRHPQITEMGAKAMNG